jgi:hypothetical protein
MFRRIQLSAHLSWLPILLAGLFASGCATLSEKPDLGLTDMVDRPEAEQTPSQTQTQMLQTSQCTVVLQPARGKPKVMQVPITEGDTVQTALDHSKAAKRFRRVNIHVLRSPRGQADLPGQVQKMQVEYDRKHDEVEIEYDYALYPNDRVVVEEDPSTILDDMVEKFTGRFGIPVLNNMIR